MIAPEAPVLLVLFNRPDQTRRVMDLMRRVKPRRLYVAADGPRAGHPTDAARCADVRAIASDIDWDCEAAFRFLDRNEGCRLAVAGAITWLFGHEERGIIIEDDIEADPSLFPFAAELLERYKDDARIGIISGCNFTTGGAKTDDSYFFVRNMHLWGWATWRRAWRLVDVSMADWNEHRSAAFIEERYGAPWATRVEWERHFDNTVNRAVDTWDYQVCYSFWRRGMLAITPALNLIDNHGFGSDATHPQAGKPAVLLANPPRAISFPLRHPETVALHPTADAILDRDAFGISETRSRRIARKMWLRKAWHSLTGQYA